MEAMRSLAPGDPFGRSVLRAVLIIVAVVLTLYVIYLLRKPVLWLVIAAFIAVAMSGPVNLFSRVMKRGFAVALSYLILIMIPIGLGALFIPTVVNQAETLANNVPQYARDVTQFVNENPTLRNLNDKYDFTSEIESLARELPARIGDAAGILSDIGVGVVNSIFAVVTILILSIFMVAGGPRWRRAFVAAQAPERGDRIDRTLQHISHAIGNYVGGVLLQATIAATLAFLVLTILGVPFAGPLALLYFFFELIPVVGATIAAVLIAIVVLFATPFPLGLIVWIIFAIVYQQVENYVIQPQIQKRAAKLEPFVILVAVLFGATLFGIVGAILAIPAAASIQIAVREYLHYRSEIEAPASDPAVEAPTATQPAS
jgi:predicted PurR-regulated permease PerM